MGCGCGKKKRLPKVAPAAARWEQVVGKPYVNSTDKVLQSRNPRFEVKPGDKIELTSAMINGSVRTWIRSGLLTLEA